MEELENNDIIYDVSRYNGGNLEQYAKSLGYKNWKELSSVNNNISDKNVRVGQTFRYNFRNRSNGEVASYEDFKNRINNTKVDSNDLRNFALRDSILNDKLSYEKVLSKNPNLNKNTKLTDINDPYKLVELFPNTYNKALFDAIDSIGKELNLNSKQIAALKGNAYHETYGGSKLIKGSYEGPFHMGPDSRKFYTEDTGNIWNKEDYSNIVRWVVGLLQSGNTKDGRLQNTDKYLKIWNNANSSVDDLSDAFEYMFERSGAGHESRKKYSNYFFKTNQPKKFESGGSVELDNSNLKQIEINDTIYNVKVCDTDELRMEGLSNVSEMSESEGAIFLFESPIRAADLTFTMENMDFDLDILFVDSNDKVTSITHGKAGDIEPVIPDCNGDIEIAYVIELNANSGINIGDEVDLEPEETSDEEVDKLYVLDENGNPQYELLAGARIFSRIHSKTLIKKAKKARRTKKDSDYKSLARYMFGCIEKQNSQDSEYVSLE